MLPAVAVQPASRIVPAGVGMRRAAFGSSAPKIIAAAALLASVVAGALLTRNVPLGVALVGACCFVPLVFFELPLAIAAWVPIASIEYSSVVGKAPLLGAGLLVVAWLGRRRTDAGVRAAGAALRPAAVALGLLLVWMTLSIVWAADPSEAWREDKTWYLAAAAFVVIATTMTSPRHVRLLAVAFVLGALLSILVGLTGKGISTTANAIELAARQRFSGGAGDPNYLAAGLVAAIALAGGLLPSARRPVAKLALGAAIAAMAAALAATESRGGLIAVGVAILTAIVIARGHRLQATAFAVFAIAAAGTYFLATPSALDRVTSFDAGGAGRTELWTVAWRESGDHPVLGVGLGGFPVEAKKYVREPGTLTFVSAIAEQPTVTHNVYLQQLAETGIVGLALLLAVFGACVAAAARAARRFEAAGETSLAVLARSAVVAMLAFLTASFFISNSTDSRLWIVLALGPALLGAAGGVAPRTAQQVRLATQGSITRR